MIISCSRKSTSSLRITSYNVCYTKLLRDLSPKGIRTHLQLNRPIYSPSAAYGHFGRQPADNGAFSWEKTDLTSELARLVN